MALVNTPTAKLTFDWLDASGSKATTVVHVPYATLAATAIAAADVIVAAMAALSDATCLGYSLAYVKNETEPAAPNAGSRVEEKGNFVWRTSNARSTRFTIPAIKDSLLLTDGGINHSALTVIALVDAVIGGDVVFGAADGSDITSLLEAYQSFRKSTKESLPRNR